MCSMRACLVETSEAFCDIDALALEIPHLLKKRFQLALSPYGILPSRLMCNLQIDSNLAGGITSVSLNYLVTAIFCCAVASCR